MKKEQKLQFEHLFCFQVAKLAGMKTAKLSSENLIAIAEILEALVTGAAVFENPALLIQGLAMYRDKCSCFHHLSSETVKMLNQSL